MKIVICLGNPGNKYSNTRHNTGFMFADNLADNLGMIFSNEPKFKSEIAKGTYNNESIWIIKPQTYMNLSGEALRALINFYKISMKDVFLVYDDISLDLGKIRLRNKGSDGGHNGIKSIILNGGTQEFDRLKIGIGPQPCFMKSEDYVLQNFSSEELKLLNETLKKAIEAFKYYCSNGITNTQNKFN